MPTETIVEEKYKDFSALLDYLSDSGNISLINDANSIMQKTFLLCMASYFEKRLTNVILEYTHNMVAEGCVLPELIKNQVIERRYHTWFNWTGNNANSFFSMFGVRFAERMKIRVRSDENLDQAIKDFLEIGRERNILIHNDFGSHSFEKTLNELYTKYESANYFLRILPDCLMENAPNNADSTIES